MAEHVGLGAAGSVRSGCVQTIVLLEVVLEAASHPDFEVASLTLNTVGRIASRVQQTPPDGLDGRERLHSVFSQIVSVLATRARRAGARAAAGATVACQCVLVNCAALASRRGGRVVVGKGM